MEIAAFKFDGKALFSHEQSAEVLKGPLRLV